VPKILSLLTLFILLQSNIFAQTEDIFIPSLRDTVLRYQGINPMIIYPNDFDFYYSHNFTVSESEQLIEGNLLTLKMRTELVLSYPATFNTNSAEGSNYFLLPFYNQYLENSKISPISYVLGLAQTAAVGYMAYLHIKKYGFWK
jgi:hypothetical protein